MTPALEAYLAALVRVLKARLGDGLVGAYLHGSAVLGGWREDRSDVDVLAVCAAAVDDPGLEELVQGLSVQSCRARSPGVSSSGSSRLRVRHRRAPSRGSSST